MEPLQNDVRALKERPIGWKSVIVSDFPEIFAEFRGQQFSLLWRGSRNGFDARTFHIRCDSHAPTLTVILDTNGNIFGGFTPENWSLPRIGPIVLPGEVSDPSGKSFLFTLKNPHNFPARRFALKDEMNIRATHRDHEIGPHFCDIGVSNRCNANTENFTHNFGNSYTNDTGLDGRTFFTGSTHFQVKEIEVFELIN
jgi:hypothetical protein